MNGGVIGVGCCLGTEAMSDVERKDVGHKWKQGQIRVMVATDAFGVGINSHVDRVRE